jgi:DNA-directed RNA polymerase subunit L
MMEVNVLKSEKDQIEIELGNVTIAEILRVYLNKDSSVDFAAWKRDHPTKNPVLAIKSKGKNPKKVVADAINAIVKDLDKVDSDFKKMK